MFYFSVFYLFIKIDTVRLFNRGPDHLFRVYFTIIIALMYVILYIHSSRGQCYGKSTYSLFWLCVNRTCIVWEVIIWQWAVRHAQGALLQLTITTL